jgi:hypothetical protein
VKIPSWVPYEQEGQAAYRRGDKRFENPYEPGTQEHFYWDCGFFGALMYDLYQLNPWPLDATMSVQ